MACPSGIRADQELFKFFGDCKAGKVRLGKIVIKKERLTVNYHTAPSKDWRADWQRDLPNCLDSYEPCFVIFKIDDRWILICFADDKASARDKMVLAATKASFKQDFGLSYFSGEYQVASTHELNLSIFEPRLQKPVGRDDETAPLTSIEREMHSVHKDRVALPLAMKATQALRGVQFPIDQDATALLKSFASGAIDFIQLSVDTLNEAIKLESHKDQLDADQLGQNITRKKPRYSLFRMKSVEDSPVFFIYSIPPSATCTIKELMLFSSCKAPFLTEIEHTCGVKVDKKIEVDSRDKLDTESLLSYWRPAVVEKNPVYIRPPRPGGGPRRITTATE